MSTTQRAQASELTNESVATGGAASDQEQHAEVYRQLNTVLAEEGWLAEFLRSLLSLHERGRMTTPKDVEYPLGNCADEFTVKMENAVELLKFSPLALREQIQEAVQRHPELLGVE